MAVAEATVVPAAAQLGAHAASPVGHSPDRQSWAEPGSPPTPWQRQVQQPQSLAVVQACPGGVDPGPGRPVALLEQPAARMPAVRVMRKRADRGLTRRTLAQGRGVYHGPPGATFVSVVRRRVARYAPW